jgi:superfamily II DNA or RNA helicase
MMPFARQTVPHDIIIKTAFDKAAMDKVVLNRWNIFKNEPIRAAGELCYIMRSVVNSDKTRLEALRDILHNHMRVIIFYNFDYELEALRAFCEGLGVDTYEWNGHKHDDVPKAKRWVYLVQYSAGAEGWNCIDTNVTVFYSQNYSYKIMVQAAGRIDRLNTPFTDLYYYHLRSDSAIDLAIAKALKTKRNFNITRFEKEV